ncbi:MAG: HAMP domain-containing protein [Chloroflexi bacterium]|nr:HAMP domain-containing protein [Chloroflexota bacterium]
MGTGVVSPKALAERPDRGIGGSGDPHGSTRVAGLSGVIANWATLAWTRPARGLGAIGLRTKLAVFSVALVVIGAGGSAAAGWQILDRLLEQSSTDRLNIATFTFASMYQQRVAEAELVIRQLSERPQSADAIETRNVASLMSIIDPVPTLRPYYSLIIADATGVILARAPKPRARSVVDTRIFGIPGAAEALESGTTISALTAMPDCQLMVSVSAPVLGDDRLPLGVIQLRFPLDEEFVRQVKTDTGLDSSIYCGDRLLATTLPGGTGAPGARAPADVTSAVIGRASAYEATLTLPGGREYRARWVPLVDFEGRAIGMYGVGNPVQSVLDARAQILNVYVPVMGAVAIAALVLASLGSVVLSVPLRRLAISAERMGSGDFVTPIPGASSRDEVGRLAQQMDEMRASIASTYSQLQELNTLKDEYLFSVAHEIRTPMSSLVAIVEVMTDDLGRMPEVEVRANIGRVARAVVRLNTLVENVLDAGSLRAGRFSVRMGKVDLDDVIDQALATVSPLFEEKGQVSRVVVSDAPGGSSRDTTMATGHFPLVWGDERRLGQVFANLLSNASKYGPAGDTITIRLAREEAGVSGRSSTVRVSVSDNGPGIPLPEQADVFERHFRASSAVLAAPGTGLGLAITRAIIEAHGGQVGIESDHGRGTTVWVTLGEA